MGSSDATQLARAVLPWRDGAGKPRVTVIVKVTFALRPAGLAELADALPLTGDVAGDPAHPDSLSAASDFVPLKLYSDVVVASPFCPHGAAARQVVGFAVARGAEVRLERRLVAVGDPARLVDPEAPGRAVSLGPVAPGSPSRASYLAAEHAALLGAEPLALPDGFDLRFFQSAPPEQQMGRLRGGERLLLVGLSPAARAVACRLPALHPFAEISGPGAARRDVALAGDTLWIDASRMVATLTFRGSIAIERRFAKDAASADAFSLRTGLAPCDDIEATLAEPRAWSAFFARPKRDLAPSPSVDPVTLDNDSGFAAGTLAWSPDPKTVRRTVIVKGTFDIAEGGGAVTLAPAQEELHGDIFAGDGERAELERASDFVPIKPRADVLLRGTAHAAPGKTAALVSLTMGTHAARVVALQPRTWGQDGVPRASGPFAPVPLRHAHALGGPGFSANPVGTGVAEGSPPPLVEDPDRLMRTRADRPRPAALAPVSPAWEARRSLVGTFDAAWQRERWPCFPANFDPAYFQAAPAELRPPHLAGDEAFRVEHVRPGGGAVLGTLSGLVPRAFVMRESAENPVETALHLDTVVLDTDAMRVTLTWRGSFELGARTAHVTVLRDDLRAPRSLDDIAALLCARAAPGLAALEKKPAAPSGPFTLGEVLQAKASKKGGKRALAGLALALGGGTGVFAEAADRPPPPKAPPPPSKSEVEAMLAAGKDLRKVDLSGAQLAGIDLSGRDLSGVLLANANLTGARLAAANLTGANLSGILAPQSVWDGANLARADLSFARLKGASLSHAQLGRARLASADLEEARLEGAEGEGTSFVRANLARARLASAKLPKADFSHASAPHAVLEKALLDDAKLYETDAPQAVFNEASLGDARFEKAILTGASFAGVKAEGAVFEQADLNGASFRKAEVSGSVFSGAHLARADLRGAAARSALFKEANLESARLDGADLMRASFEGADLRRAVLAGANLYQAETWLARTENADFTGAHLAGTKLAPRSK